MQLHAPRPVGLGALAAAVLALAACGSDGDSGAVGVEEFCAEAVALEEANADSEDETVTQADLDEMRGLASRAPDEVRDDIETIADAMAETLDIDEDDFEGFFEIFFSPEVLAAGEALNEFLVNECGMESTFDDGDTIEAGGVDEASDPDGDAFVPDVSGVEDPLFDPFFSDDEVLVDPDVASIEGLQVHLDLEYTDAPWRTSLSSFQSGSQWRIGGFDLGDAGEEICAAVGTYLAEIEPDAVIWIDELDDETFDPTPLVTGSPAGRCSMVDPADLPEPVDVGPGTTELTEFLETEYAGMAFLDAIFGTFLVNDEWSLDATDWGGEEMQACSAVARFLNENGIDATVTIRLVDLDAGTAEVVATGDGSGVCSGA